MARFGAATHSGLCRENNEAAVAFDAELGVGVVADGLGGLDSGEVASRTVIDCVLDAVRAGHSCTDGILAAHQQILGAIPVAEPGSTRRDRMGSTVVAVRLQADKAQLAWVGDSRCYLLRDGELRQLTLDHTFAAALMAAGAITGEEAARHPLRNQLVCAVGVADKVSTLKVDELDVPLVAGDRLLVCSDGLHGFLPAEVMVRTLALGDDAAGIAQKLVELTLEQTPAGDNVTALCILVNGP
jgi:PPM family protein phosphatase